MSSKYQLKVAVIQVNWVAAIFHTRKYQEVIESKGLITMPDIMATINKYISLTKFSPAEVVTPMNIVKDMVDLLPAEIYVPSSKFLDPAVKSGRFLLELFNRLMTAPAMIEAFPNAEERKTKILTEQLFGLATSEFAATISRKALYDDPNETGNIHYVDGYISKMTDKKTDYKVMIEKEFGQQMGFDVVIGNPPYQENTKTIYQDFIGKAMLIKAKHIIMIVKSNWLTSDTLRTTRDNMINYGIKKIINFPIANEIFNNVGVTVNIFYMEYGYHGNTLFSEQKNGILDNQYTADFRGAPAIFSNKIEQSILSKIAYDLAKGNFGNRVYPCECFRINSNFSVGRGHNSYNLNPSIIESNNYNVKVAYMEGRDLDYQYIRAEDVPARKELIGYYKVLCGARFNKNSQVIYNINTIEKNSVCTASWGMIYASQDYSMAKNAESYIKTQLCRFLVRLLCDGTMTNLSPYRFSLVPLQDFSHPWTDQMLYEKYNFTQEEIDYIEKTIKPMD